MNRPNYTPGPWYASSLLGSPGNYEVEIRAHFAHDGGETDKHICTVQSSRMPVQLSNDSLVIASVPALLKALEKALQACARMAQHKERVETPIPLNPFGMDEEQQLKVSWEETEDTRFAHDAGKEIRSALEKAGYTF